MKQIIKITEEDLHKIVKESVKRIIEGVNTRSHEYDTFPNGGWDSYAYEYDYALDNANSIDDWDKMMKKREEMSKLRGSNAQNYHPARVDSFIEKLAGRPYGGVGSRVYTHPKEYHVEEDPLERLEKQTDHWIKNYGYPA